MEAIKSGADTLDAVIAGVNIPNWIRADTSVGYGGLPNEDGVVELDASVMHGPSRRGGAVGALRGIKTPSKIAQLVMARDRPHDAGGRRRTALRQGLRVSRKKICSPRARAWPGACGSAKCATRRPYQLGERHGCAAREEDRPNLKKAFPAADEEPLAWAYGDGGESAAARHHQLPGAERKGRDVRGDHHQRRWPGRSPAAWAIRRSSAAACGWIRTSAPPVPPDAAKRNLRVCGGAHDCREHAARHAPERSDPRCVEAGGSQLR